MSGPAPHPHGGWKEATPVVASAGEGWEAEPRRDRALTGLGLKQTRFTASVGLSTRSGRLPSPRPPPLGAARTLSLRRRWLRKQTPFVKAGVEAPKGSRYSWLISADPFYQEGAVDFQLTSRAGPPLLPTDCFPVNTTRCHGIPPPASSSGPRHSDPQRRLRSRETAQPAARRLLPAPKQLPTPRPAPSSVEMITWAAPCSHVTLERAMVIRGFLTTSLRAVRPLLSLLRPHWAC